jgi:hypothetical protein
MYYGCVTNTKYIHATYKVGTIYVPKGIVRLV